MCFLTRCNHLVGSTQLMKITFGQLWSRSCTNSATYTSYSYAPYWQLYQQNHSWKWSHYLGIYRVFCNFAIPDYKTAASPSQTFYTLLNIYFPWRKSWHDTLISTLSTVTLFNNNLMWRLQQTNNHQGWVWQTENIVFQFSILSPDKEVKFATDAVTYEKHWFCNLRNPLWFLLYMHPFCAFLESACRDHYKTNKALHLYVFYLLDCQII